MIGKLLKGLIKKIIGKSTKKAGVDPGTGKTIIDVAGDLLNKDPDIQREIRQFILTFEGQYADLKTKAEGIVRTMLRPFLTVFFSVNVVVMIYLKMEIKEIMFWATITLIGSWCGTKGARDFQNFKKFMTKIKKKK